MFLWSSLFSDYPPNVEAMRKIVLMKPTGSIFEAGADTRRKVASSFNEWIAELETR